jgi:dGTPase
MVVNFADRIAYINHDIDDALRAGVISEIPKECIQGLGFTHGERINTMITDIVFSSAGKPQISMSENIAELTEKLRQFMFTHVYLGSVAKIEETKAESMLEMLFELFMKKPEMMGKEAMRRVDDYGLRTTVTDYIAGMTDRYAVALFRELYIPKGWYKY